MLLCHNYDKYVKLKNVLILAIKTQMRLNYERTKQLKLFVIKTKFSVLMKSIVKNITTLMIVVITFTSAEFVNANTATADSLQLTESEQMAQDNRIEKALLFGLKSDVNGILESTFYNTIAYKTLNPDFESTKLLEEISRVAMEKKNHVVRYKAFLALSYLQNFDEFSGNSQEMREYVGANNSIAAFQVIIDNLEKQQIATN